LGDYEEQRRRLVSHLKSYGIIRSESVERAFTAVPREEFVPEQIRDQSYLDIPLPLMDTGQTISAPHMVAYMVEALDLSTCHKVLEVGAGSGYAAAILAELVGPSLDRAGHKVYTVEIDPRLVEFAKHNLQRCGYSDRVEVILGDGSLGLQREAPFDRILVSAAAADVPEPLVDQLAEGGGMAIPVGGGAWSQALYLVKKDRSGKVTRQYLMDVMFVPLRGHS